MANEIQTRNTVFALTKEVTEGTPVVPSGATDFASFREGFTVAPSFTELENDALASSIGQSKNALGFEEPTASVSHYLNHSGVEGTAPEYDILLENALGEKQTNGSERTVAAGSSATVVKVAASGDTDFPRGMALLVKDSALTSGGYEIRNSTSATATDITLAQELSGTPTTGVGLGKCVGYRVVDSGHPTLNLWTYRANGGAVELLRGGRCNSMTLNFNAGELITADFDIQGIGYNFDPLTTTSSNFWLDFSDSVPTTYEVSVAAKTWESPYELAQAVEDAMNATASGDTFTVSYSDSTRKFTIASDNATFNILWQTGTHGSAGTDTHIGTLLGFDDAANDSAQSNPADNAQDWSASYTPTYDSSDPLVAKNNQVMLGLSDEITCFGAQTVSVNYSNEITNIDNVCSSTGRSGSLVSGRGVTVDIVAYLTTGQADEFDRFRSNTEIIFTYNAGTKSGGNWVAGTCTNIHIPTARISSFEITDTNGIVTLTMQIQGFVSSGLGEFYLNFL